MHGQTNIKFINAKQAKEIYAYKNTKRRLYKSVLHNFDVRHLRCLITNLNSIWESHKHNFSCVYDCFPITV
jgi:hypothetical protein